LPVDHSALSRRGRQDPLRIVSIGGGTGLSTLLKGLKKYVSPAGVQRAGRVPAAELSAIVTMTDDGGSSGRLRRELEMLPPGDIRNCILALADTSPLMNEVLNYRFRQGSLEGQNLGNLFLLALNEICGSFDEAVAAMNRILAVKGQVLPVCNRSITLCAEFEDGSVVRGETSITAAKKQSGLRIRRVSLLPESTVALQSVIEAIDRAEVIVLGPGSLYTSIIPNLLVGNVAAALRRSRALRIYALNVMTQEGETEGYSTSDHIAAIFKHSAPGLFNLCLTNSTPISEDVTARYAEEGAEQIVCDLGRCAQMGVEIVLRPVAMVENGFVRHQPDDLARELMRLQQERSVRIAGDRVNICGDAYQVEKK